MYEEVRGVFIYRKNVAQISITAESSISCDCKGCIQNFFFSLFKLRKTEFSYSVYKVSTAITIKRK